ncbi:MAG: response regulator, partial [Planctomycetota bacterium]|nr:response regulator [Planctomycetota bacterium]
MNGAKILIVEDDPGVRRVLEFRLKASGNRVTAVDCGREALAAIEREPFDIVLTDLCMPGMDGIALLKEVKRLCPDVQVIILTAYGTLDTAIEALRDAQAFDYISKPVDIDALNSRIQAALAARAEQALAAKTRSGRFLATPADDPDPADPLTGFPCSNSLKRTICCIIGRFARARQRFSIVILDVDHFGYFNLLNGRREGEHLLTELAALIRQNIRKGDSVFRIGEDRFAIVLPEMDDRGAEAVADRIRGSVA